jgi:hypothetical protein
MSTVKYHSICDICGKESVEYTAFGWCKNCGKDVCPEHTDPESYDPETCIALCTECAKNPEDEHLSPFPTGVEA